MCSLYILFSLGGNWLRSVYTQNKRRLPSYASRVYHNPNIPM